MSNGKQEAPRWMHYVLFTKFVVIALFVQTLAADAQFSCLDFRLHERGQGAHTLHNICPVHICVAAYHNSAEVGELSVCAKPCGEGYIQDNPAFGYSFTGGTDTATYSSLCTGVKAPAETESTGNSDGVNESEKGFLADIEKKLSEQDGAGGDVSKVASALAEEVHARTQNRFEPDVSIEDRAQDIADKTEIQDAKVIAALRRAEKNRVAQELSNARRRAGDNAQRGMYQAWNRSTLYQCRITCSNNRSQWSGFSNYKKWDMACEKGCKTREHNRVNREHARQMAQKHAQQRAYRRAQQRLYNQRQNRRNQRTFVPFRAPNSGPVKIPSMDWFYERGGGSGSDCPAGHTSCK